MSSSRNLNGKVEPETPWPRKTRLIVGGVICVVLVWVIVNVYMHFRSSHNDERKADVSVFVIGMQSAFVHLGKLSREHGAYSSECRNLIRAIDKTSKASIHEAGKAILFEVIISGGDILPGTEQTQLKAAVYEYIDALYYVYSKTNFSYDKAKEDLNEIMLRSFRGSVSEDVSGYDTNAVIQTANDIREAARELRDGGN